MRPVRVIGLASGMLASCGAHMDDEWRADLGSVCGTQFHRSEAGRNIEVPHDKATGMNDLLRITTLYRPTGEAELRLVIDSGFSTWPDRLPEQPIFYPVTNEDYAVQIARDWNSAPQRTGFVTSFDVEATYLDRFDQKVVGDSRTHIEYWVPAEDLDEFNLHIVGPIRVIRAFTGSPPHEVDVETALAGVSPDR